MYRVIAAKLPDDNIAGAVSAIEGVWDRIVPGVPIEYSFLEDAIRNSYESEHKVGTLFGTFSILAVVVACLGLFGLAAYASEQRTKEIGIRKVLGASMANIVRLLFKEFLALVIVANVIAWPLAYYAISRWLEDFAYRMDISWAIFVSSGILAFVIALLAVGYQALKAAIKNPVETLKYE
jgi:putative ABC transport system permease protein